MLLCYELDCCFKLRQGVLHRTLSKHAYIKINLDFETASSLPLLKGCATLVAASLPFQPLFLHSLL